MSQPEVGGDGAALNGFGMSSLRFKQTINISVEIALDAFGLYPLAVSKELAHRFHHSGYASPSKTFIIRLPPGFKSVADKSSALWQRFTEP